MSTNRKRNAKHRNATATATRVKSNARTGNATATRALLRARPLLALARLLSTLGFESEHRHRATLRERSHRALNATTATWLLIRDHVAKLTGRASVAAWSVGDAWSRLHALTVERVERGRGPDRVLVSSLASRNGREHVAPTVAVSVDDRGDVERGWNASDSARKLATGETLPLWWSMLDGSVTFDDSPSSASVYHDVPCEARAYATPHRGVYSVVYRVATTWLDRERARDLRGVNPSQLRESTRARLVESLAREACVDFGSVSFVIRVAPDERHNATREKHGTKSITLDAVTLVQVKVARDALRDPYASERDRDRTARATVETLARASDAELLDHAERERVRLATRYGFDGGEVATWETLTVELRECDSRGLTVARCGAHSSWPRFAGERATVARVDARPRFVRCGAGADVTATLDALARWESRSESVACFRWEPNKVSFDSRGRARWESHRVAVSSAVGRGYASIRGRTVVYDFARPLAKLARAERETRSRARAGRWNFVGEGRVASVAPVAPSFGVAPSSFVQLGDLSDPVAHRVAESLDGESVALDFGSRAATVTPERLTDYGWKSSESATIPVAPFDATRCERLHVETGAVIRRPVRRSARPLAWLATRERETLDRVESERRSRALAAWGDPVRFDYLAGLSKVEAERIRAKRDRGEATDSRYPGTATGCGAHRHGETVAGCRCGSLGLLDGLDRLAVLSTPALRAWLDRDRVARESETLDRWNAARVHRVAVERDSLDAVERERVERVERAWLASLRWNARRDRRVATVTGLLA